MTQKAAHMNTACELGADTPGLLVRGRWRIRTDSVGLDLDWANSPRWRGVLLHTAAARLAGMGAICTDGGQADLPWRTELQQIFAERDIADAFGGPATYLGTGGFGETWRVGDQAI